MTKPATTVLLSEPDIEVLYSTFENKRSTLICPGNKETCNQKGTMRLHGKNKGQNPPQPQFRCSKCTSVFNAFKMQQLLNSSSSVNDKTDLDTNATDMDFLEEISSFDSQPEQIQFILKELQSQKEQLKQHTSQFIELNKLREELESAHIRIAELEEKNKELRQKLAQQTTKEKDSQVAEMDFPPLTQHSPSSQNSTATAARAFQRPSTTHGFQYIYFPSKARMPVGRMRASLRQLGADNSRILDIQYPARQTIGLLVHNDFAKDLLETLKQVDILPVDFDPLDPKFVHDPKYQDLPEAEKANIAHELQGQRAKKAIKFIRALLSTQLRETFKRKVGSPLRN
ncbi:hypothetical protein BDA99DRAFT_534058 [Phascolomyces articulosus]|uniref:Uncharacterized protein n=1 Tax=Phascolomyces articulosus TaxID=60185 RepID=A0AAD5PH82_9FUNG|nr:hypothetical protein BDA99DRAFT_534058 [Phascolomyces articulosus]